MSAIQLSDREILERIQAGGQQQNTCIKHLYIEYRGFFHRAKEMYPAIPISDLKDIYTDAMIAFRDMIVSGRFREESKCSTFFFSIFRKKCIDQIRKQTTQLREGRELEYDLPEDLQDANIDLEQALIVREDVEQLLSYFSQLGETCKNVLLDWAYHGYSMEEIAKRNGLNNARTAASTRYNCLKRLMRIIESDNADDASP